MTGEKRFTAVDARLGLPQERRDAIDTQLEGWRYLADVGSPVAHGRDHETRLAALEGTPA